MSLVTKRFNDQDFEALKRKHNSSNLFCDSSFPANNSSLYFSDDPNVRKKYANVVWKRPREIVNNPKFVVDGYRSIDINQGFLGDCWFIAAIIGITECPMILAKVVPSDQSFDEGYSGIFHFKFYQYGDWYDVVIDDRLPYLENPPRLVFCHNIKTPNEFWAPLLEKAYAKLKGSYESLEGGILGDGLMDMTGGIVETLFPKEFLSIVKKDEKKMNKLWSSLFQSYFKNTLMGCCVAGNVYESLRADGIAALHAYTITKMAVVLYKGKETKLVRIKNPHGIGASEWNGAWSDKSQEWNYVKNKDELNANEKEGEFWMSFNDFIKTWDRIYLCHLTCDSFIDHLDKAGQMQKISWKNLADDTWSNNSIKSKWVAGKSSCGYDIDSEKYWNNPKYFFTIENRDNKAKSTILLELSQPKESRSSYEYKHSIRLDLFKLPAYFNPSEGITKEIQHIFKVMGGVNYTEFLPTGQVNMKNELENGTYLIVACTDIENTNHEYMIRIFADEYIKLQRLENTSNKNNLSSFDPSEGCGINGSEIELNYGSAPMEACSHCHLESCTDSKSCSSLVQDKPFVTRLSQLDLQKVQDRPFVSRLSQLDLQKVQDRPFVSRLSQLDLQKVQDRPFVSRLSQLDLQKSCTKCNSETCRDSVSCMSLSTNIPTVQACSHCNLESCKDSRSCSSLAQNKPYVSRLSQLDLQKSCTKCNSETCRDSASCMSLSTNIPAVQACSDCNLESCQNPKPPRSISICKSANLNMNEPKFPNVKKGPKTNDQCNIC